MNFQFDINFHMIEILERNQKIIIIKNEDEFIYLFLNHHYDIH